VGKQQKSLIDKKILKDLVDLKLYDKLMRGGTIKEEEVHTKFSSEDRSPGLIEKNDIGSPRRR